MHAHGEAQRDGNTGVGAVRLCDTKLYRRTLFELYYRGLNSYQDYFGGFLIMIIVWCTVYPQTLLELLRPLYYIDTKFVGTGAR